jgi:hypothetical protein
MDKLVAADAEPMAVAHPAGPRGVHPKKRLTGGIWTIGTSRPAEARAEAMTAGLRLPATIV